MMEYNADRDFARRPGAWRRHRRWVLAGSLLCGLAAFVIGHFQTKTYRATTYLLVSESKITSAPETQAGRDVLLSYVPWSWQIWLFPTYVPLIDNEALISQVIQRLHLDQAPYRLTAQRFRKGRYLDVKIPKATRLLEIQVEFPDPRLASDIANDLAQGAAEFNAQLNASDTLATQKILKQRLDEAASHLAEIESKHLKLREQAGIENKEQQLSILFDQKKQLSIQIENLRLSLAQSESRAKFLAGAQAGQAARDQLVSSAADAEAQRAGLQVATATLAQTDSEISRLLTEVRRSRSEIEKADSDHALAREAFEAASRDFRNAAVTASGKSADLTQVAPAVVPEKPVGPNILFNTLIATVLGLVLLSGAAVVMEGLRGTHSETVGLIGEEESVNLRRS